MRWSAFPLVVFLCVVCARSASAQQPPAPAPAPAPPQPAPAPAAGSSFGDRVRGASDQTVVSNDVIRWIGDVELPIDAKTTLSADQIEFVRKTNLLVATGNVVFAGMEGRISAEKVEYDVDKGTGTFTEAFGIMPLGPLADRKQFGNQDADVYFFGQTIETIFQDEA